MPIQAVEPRRLYRQIADQIRALIAESEFTPGSRLPPERDLARQLRVSRPSVREALIALEVEGLLDVRRRDHNPLDADRAFHISIEARRPWSVLSCWSARRAAASAARCCA
jgi:DNA-binding FadR family transcriptional regulator